MWRIWCCFGYNSGTIYIGCQFKTGTHTPSIPYNNYSVKSMEILTQSILDVSLRQVRTHQPFPTLFLPFCYIFYFYFLIFAGLIVFNSIIIVHSMVLFHHRVSPFLIKFKFELCCHQFYWIRRLKFAQPRCVSICFALIFVTNLLCFDGQ